MDRGDPMDEAGWDSPPYLAPRGMRPYRDLGR